MARATRCDRCGCYETGTPVMEINLTAESGPGRIVKKELCTPCCALLHDFLEPADQDQPMNDYAGGV